ncbi:MAG TPA: ABC transporter permease [Micromonosporaceae bacterium]|nr:ABC transporter permease [Micromonosporaceae bacterium]
MIRVELGKLVRRPRVWVSIGLLCLLPIIVAIFISTTRIAPPPGQGGAFLSAVLSNGALYPAAAMALVVPLFLPVATAVLAGDAVAGEATTGTLRYLLIRPVGRTRLLVAKLVTLTAFVLMAVVILLLTSFVTGELAFGSGTPGQPGVTSLSGTTLTPTDIALRLTGSLLFVTVSMLGVAAIAVFLSTVTDSPLGATLGALAVLVGSELLATLGAAGSIAPYLPTRYWLAWVDFFRQPILWRDIERGIGLQVVYVLVFLGAAWANFMTKDVKS